MCWQTVLSHFLLLLLFFTLFPLEFSFCIYNYFTVSYAKHCDFAFSVDFRFSFFFASLPLAPLVFLHFHKNKNHTKKKNRWNTNRKNVFRFEISIHHPECVYYNYILDMATKKKTLFFFLYKCLISMMIVL